MPSLFKFLILLIMLGAIGAGAAFALATFVDPNPRETIIRIPSKDLK